MNNKKIAGVVAEYNPFHNGHAYQLNKIREMGFEKIVCVISGNSVQRGEFAISDKYSRAKAAVKCGADLVLELPYPYSSSGAEFFAAAGVHILNASGVGTLCFGSECADIEQLKRAATVCESEDFKNAYKDLSSSRFGTASAFFEAYKRVSGDEFDFGSNDLLGISYIRAIIKNGYDIEPVAIKREGSAYTEKKIENMTDYPSAMMIREAIEKNVSVETFMPPESFEVLSECVCNGKAPCRIENIESAILAFFRLADAEDLSSDNIAECGGGLCERLCKCAHKSASYAEFVELAKGKKYTESRVKRAILAAMTGATEAEIRALPAYTLVLAMNRSGREILSGVRKLEKDIDFYTKPADAPISKSAERLDALYALANPKPTKSGEFIMSSPFVAE